MQVLRGRSLVKSFRKKKVVDDVTVEVCEGEVVGLLGPNGAGKTTTISMIAGVLPRDAGSVEIDGIDLDDGPPARARIGLVTQGVTLYPDLTARENLRFWGRLYDLSGPELARRVDSMLSAVGRTPPASSAWKSCDTARGSETLARSRSSASLCLGASASASWDTRRHSPMR